MAICLSLGPSLQLDSHPATKADCGGDFISTNNSGKVTIGRVKQWRQIVEVDVDRVLLLTLSAIRDGLGVSYLPCSLGDAAPQLERYREPDPVHNLGLWVLQHPDSKRTAGCWPFAIA